MYVCMHVCVYVCMYMCMYVCMCVCNDIGMQKFDWLTWLYDTLLTVGWGSEDEAGIGMRLLTNIP